MTATSNIWIIARKKKKKIKALNIDLLLSVSTNCFVG